MWSRNSQLLLAAILFIGCAPQGPDPETLAIQSLLGKRVQAINNKDLDLYASFIAPDYGDGDVTREALVRRMAGYFTRFESIRLEYSGTKIEHAQGRARVSQEVALRVSGLAEPLVNSEMLSLEKIDGHWVIVGGL